MHNDVVDAVLRIQKLRLNFMPDGVTVPNGNITIHDDVNIQRQMQADLAHAAFLDLDHAVYVARDFSNFFSEPDLTITDAPCAQAGMRSMTAKVRKS